MAIRKIIIMAAAVLFRCLLPALGPEKLLRDVISKYNTIKTYQADFVQENVWLELELSKISKGKISYDNQKLILDYIKPEGQKLYIDQDSIVVLDSQGKQALISNTDIVVSEIKPIRIIKYYSDNADLKLKKLTKNEKLLEIYPKKNDGITKIAVTIDTKSYLIKQMAYMDEQKNTVEYSFKNPILNKKIGKSVFKIRLSKDINIIDNRNQ